MKHKKLKPLLTLSVFLLPTFLLLSGNSEKPKAMLARLRPSSIKNLKFNGLNLNTSTLKTPQINKFKLPVTSSKVKISPTHSTSGKLTINKNITFKNDQLTSKSNTLPARPSSASPLKPINKSNTLSTSAPKLESRKDLTTKNPETIFQKLDPGYSTVPKPIFTPNKPGKPLPEPEVYENVIILNTSAGSLTVFKD